jgi:formamidopyrimidine-DNA glycosylase
VYDPRDEAEVMPELSRLGVDPIEDDFSVDVLEKVLHGRRSAIKTLLLNQHIIAGIGNIYADEILHRCRLRWNRPANELSRRQLSTLSSAITEVLSAAIEAGGSTLDDTQYVNVDGSFGGYQHEHRVYGRAGALCVTCGKSRIVRVAVAGRGTWYCPRCQR